MPGRNKTGPLGDGPMTGRRMGFCADNENQPGAFFGRGGRFGMGRGNRRGYDMERRGSYNTDTFGAAKKSTLEGEISILRDHLNSLEVRMKGLKDND